MTPRTADNLEIPGRRRVPRGARWVGLTAAVALAWPWGSESSTSVILPSLSPFVAGASLAALRGARLLSLLALPSLILVCLSPRWLCRHMCPVGLLQEVVEDVRPGTPLRWRNVPAIGQWFVWLTLGGAWLGCPLFLWLDPFALFNGFLNAWRQPIVFTTLMTGLGLPLLLLLDLAWPRLWCQRLCPLGATQDLLARTRRLIGMTSGRGEPQRGSDTAQHRNQRRWFLGGAVAVVGVLAARRTNASKAAVLRPPGSVAEETFTGLCVRCGNCAQACPTRIIQPDFSASGLTGLLTPQLNFDRDYCHTDCFRCGAVCPSGAIARWSSSEKRRLVIGHAAVDSQLCLLVKGGECTACIRHCPYQAMIMDTAADGFTNRPRVVEDRCNGCGACETVCPTRPARAIRVRRSERDRE